MAAAMKPRQHPKLGNGNNKDQEELELSSFDLSGGVSVTKEVAERKCL